MEENGSKNIENMRKKDNKLIILIAMICLIVFGVFVIKLNIKRNNSNGDISTNNENAEYDINGDISTNNENAEYDIKSYKVGRLYYEDFNDYYKDDEKKTSVKYNDAAYIDGEIVIENDGVYLKYEKNGVMQNKRINIGKQKPKYVMVISANVVRYVYILTEDGNVYLNTNSSEDVDAFLNFSKVNNLMNVSDIFMDGQSPYFVINNQIYNAYGEIAHHNLIIKSDGADIQTATGNDYYIQVGNDGLLYKNIIKKTYMIGSPESASSIIAHQKHENELYKNDNNENVYVSVLFGVNEDIYLIDKNGNYYKIENIGDKEIKLNAVTSKNVISVDKYSKSSIVQKIEVNYSDNTKDTYSRDNSESIW